MGSLFPGRGNIVPKAWKHKSQGVAAGVLLRFRQSLLSAQLTTVQDKYDEAQGVIGFYHALGGGVIDVGGFLNLTALHEFSKQN